MSSKKSYFRKRRILLSNSDSPLPDYAPTLGWMSIKKARRRQPYHIHADNIEICYVAKGEAHWYTKGETHKVRAGDMYIVRPGEVHGGVDALLHACEVYWLELNLDKFKSLSSKNWSELFELISDPNRRRFQVDRGISKLFKKIIQECQAPDELTSECVLCHLNELLIRATRSCRGFLEEKRIQRDARRAWSRKTESWIMENLSRPFTMEELASACDLRESRFHQLFIEETGFTPLEFTNRRRIEKSKEKLETSKTSITDIAFSLGFNSSQYFATVFKKYCGVSPSVYRRKQAPLRRN